MPKLNAYELKIEPITIYFLIDKKPAGEATPAGRSSIKILTDFYLNLNSQMYE